MRNHFSIDTHTKTLKDVSREIEESKRQRKKKKVVEKDSSGELWVDRYRPKTYSDLTGDQSLFREVLKWVKQWDYCVFRKLPPQETQRDKAMRQYEDARQQNTRRFRRFDPQEVSSGCQYVDPCSFPLLFRPMILYFVQKKRFCYYPVHQDLERLL